MAAVTDTLTTPTPTGQTEPTRLSPTMDAILNAQKRPVFRPNVRQQADMDAWKKDRFIPDSRLTGQTPRDAMNAWSLFHGAVPQAGADDGRKEPAVREGSDPGAEERPKPAVPTLGQDLRNDAQGFFDHFRKPENRKYDPDLGKYPYEPPKAATNEELLKYFHDKNEYEDEVEKRRQQRNLAISSVGDMFNALSNLYYTTRYAPSWYNEKSSMTDRQRERYDRLNAARAADNQNYINMYMNARDRDQTAKEKADALQFQRDQAAQQQANWLADFNLRQEEAAAQREERKNAREAAAEEAQKGREFTAKQNELERQSRETISGMRGGGNGRFSRTEPVPLSNGKTGKEELKFKIDPSLWNTSAPAIYSILKEDLGDRPNADEDQENYILQNWYKSDKVAQMLMNLSGIDPATMQSVYNPVVPPEPVQPTYTTRKGKKEAAKAEKHTKKADEAEKNAVGTVVTPDPNRSVVNAG